jgi:hypothetical protein
MKKQIVIMILAFLPVLLLAQNTPLSALYDKYVSKPGFESTEILPGSMSFEWEKDMNTNSIKEMLKDIKSIRILKYKENEDKNEQEKLWKKIQKAAGDDQYIEVVNVNAENTRANMYIMKGPSGKTMEVDLVVKEAKGITIVTVSGDIDFSTIFNTENMKGLREMAEYYMHNKEACNHGKD